jgi:NAD(P)-dependent dehydrogenase (short-subunit alcohol dehydrogenase family)
MPVTTIGQSGKRFTMTGLEGKVVIVTGAAGNLGQAVAAACAQAGARRVLVDRSTDRLAHTYPRADADVLLANGVDLADAAHAERLVQTVLERFARVDILVNTVGGFAGGKRVHEDEPGNWEKMFAINLYTTLNACRAVIPYLLRQGSGSIVNVAARAALTGVPTLGAYSASKSAVIRLTESLAGELKDHGITVNCVLPGTIDTPQNRRAMPNADFGRWVAPAAIADAILFLASDAARAVTGAALPVYGRS